jgi:PAS domain S-box-containing protein
MKIHKPDNKTAEDNFSSLKDIALGLKEDGTILRWDRIAEIIFGYSAIEAIGRNISFLFFEKSKEQLEKILQCNMMNHHLYCKTNTGERIRVSFTVSPCRHKEEIMISISKIATDISEQKEIEKKIATLAAIVDSSDDAIISNTLDGIITSWNPSATKLFGLSEEEALGRHISIILPPDGLAKKRVDIENIIKEGKIEHFETVRMAENGTEKFISLTMSPIKNSNGEIIGTSNVARDISDKDQQEVKQAILAAIVNSSDDAIISKTLQGIITSWNEAATRMFGYTEEEAIGKHISLIIPEDRLGEETNIIQSLSKGEKVDHFETIRVAKDGTFKNISLTISPIKDRRGKIIGASKIARDISLRKETEKQRELYTRRLLELNKYKDEFMVMASHELKTPVTVIMANLQVLHEMMKNDSNAVFIERVLKQVNKLSELITNLLNVSKIEAGQLQLNLTVFDLNELIDELVNDLQQTTKNSTIIYNKSQNKLMIHADREKIEQVLINILSNAIKYNRKQGEIIVEVHQNNEEIKVDVRDEGIGIPDEDLENIFLRFFRVSGEANSFSGSGVGLYISSQIIKSHKGKIWAESKLGEGSVFHFTLPAKL